jgi:glycosyltransferase involved in cell wall biosynthesis
MVQVNITLPVFNAALQLPISLGRLDRFLRNQSQFEYQIVIANNGSTDRTRQVAEELCGQYPFVKTVHFSHKGRGRAVKAVWTEGVPEVLSYMDVDLSTDLEAFPAMIEALLYRGFDLATGSRLLRNSVTTRSVKREVISRCYNVLIKAMFNTSFSDAQCGFKAITRKTARTLLPQIQDDGWFMDTELLVTAEKSGYRIFECPVTWVENPSSSVNIWRTAIEDVRGLVRLRRKLVKMKSRLCDERSPWK